MQTVSISLRVADFLRQHPPFDAIPQDDLLAVTQRGRVRFHECDEYVYWQKAKLNPFIYVVQRGAVSLCEESEGQEQLCDMLGAGDLFGTERFLGSTAYRLSARTNSDVVLYALHSEDFAALVEKHPQVGRYLAAHTSLESVYESSTAVRGSGLEPIADLLSPKPAPCCSAGDSLSSAARSLSQSGVYALAVLDSQGTLAGLLTSNLLLQAIGRATDLQAPCSQAMQPNPLVFGPSASASDGLLALASSTDEAIVVTSDGAPGSPLLAVLSAAELSAAFTAQLLPLLRQVPAAADFATLSWIHQRIRRSMLELLSGPGSIDWLARFAQLLDRAMLHRVLLLTGLDAAHACWCFFDASGRDETLTAARPALAALTSDDAPLPPGAVVATLEGLTACGYHGDSPHAAGSLSEWRQRFTTWIDDPIGSGINHARQFFDLTPASGDVRIWQQLTLHVSAAIRRNRVFTPLLANDALSSLPPLTFFEDLIVDEAGQQSGVFQLEQSALQPLVDVGRLLGVASGNALGFSTAERLRLGSAVAPEDNAALLDAEQALRSVLFYQARAGLRHHSAGLTLAPSELSRLDRQSLKAAFRAIARLLQVAERLAWQEAG